MKITLALVFVLSFASVSNAQCENGVCSLVPKVASVAVNAIQKIVPVSFVSDSEYLPASAQQSVSAPVPMRTPVRTILRAPFRARPLQRLFRCR